MMLTLVCHALQEHAVDRSLQVELMEKTRIPFPLLMFKLFSLDSSLGKIVSE